MKKEKIQIIRIILQVLIVVLIFFSILFGIEKAIWNYLIFTSFFLCVAFLLILDAFLRKRINVIIDILILIQYLVFLILNFFIL